MYSKYTTPSLSLSHRAHCHLHLVVVASRWHSPCVLHCRRGDGGGHPGSHHCHPRRPPPCRPHPPRGAGWWWWGRRRRCAPRHHSRPRHHLIVVPVPLLVIPLVVIDVSPWHWPWTSCCCCRHVDAGRVVGSPSIVLSSLLCPLLLSLCPLLSLSSLSPSSLSHCCPPCLPPVVVVHD